MLGYETDEVGPAQVNHCSRELFLGRQRSIAATSVVEALRCSLGLTSDMTTDISWFLTRTLAWRNSPLIVVLKENAQPTAAVLLYSRQYLGIPTGVIKGGNRSGDGLVIAAAGQRVAAVKAAISAVLALPWVHTVLVSMQETALPEQMTSLPSQSSPHSG